jgi:hypothetical protein
MDRLRQLQNPDASGLMFTWRNIIEADNKKGVLAGLDKHGVPLAPVTYRPIGKPLRLTRDQKNGIKGNRRGVSAGFGPWAAGLHNNLTHAEYERLGGPPLAPRGAYSRVITNFKTESNRPVAGAGQLLGYSRWMAYGWWDEVVATDGQTKFLKYHFWGIGQKKRDLTGVRPEGLKKARVAAVAWMRDIVRSGGV